MAKKVKKIGIKKQSGYLYFIDKDGDISSAKMSRDAKAGGKPKKIAKAGVKKEAGFLYFVDKDGDVSCAKMVRGDKQKSRNTRKDLFNNYLESFLERKKLLWLRDLRVFLSYSHKDIKKVKEINKYLKNNGINTWFDEDELKGGQVWKKEITKAIKDCFLFVSFLSENSVNSRGYFQN